MKDKNYVRLGQIYQFFQQKNKILKCLVSNFELLISNDFDVNYQLPRDSLVCQNNPQYIGNTALHFLAEFSQDFTNSRNFIVCINLLIKHGADVTIKNNDGFTPLMLAFNKTSERPSKFLANFNGRNTKNIRLKNGLSHFHVLCMTNNVEVVELFLKSGVDINERVDNDHPIYPGYTPLHFAVHYLRIKTIKLLLNYGADLNVTDARGISSKHLIARNFAERSYFKEFLEELNEFCKNTLLDSDISDLPDNLGFCRLHFVCKFNDDENSISEYLNKNVNVDCPIKLNSPIWPGCTPLHLAAKLYHSKTVEFLLEKGANILAKDANGTTPLDIIICSFRLDQIINILYSEKRYNLSNLKLTDGTYLLDIMEAMTQPREIKKFIKKNIKDVNTFIPLNSPLWPGYNLLHLQAVFDDRKYRFVNRGVNFLMLNAEGMSPLHLAFRKRSYNLIREIREFIFKRPVNLIDPDNLSHLHVLCAECLKYERDYALKAVECLLKNGADPNTATLCDFPWSFNLERCLIKKGSTPLHIALHEKNIPLVNKLMSYGANPCIADSTGVTPFRLALIKLTEKSFFSEKPDHQSIEKLIAQMLESRGKYLMAGEEGVKILRKALLLVNNKYTELLKQMVKEFDREKRYKELGLTRLQVACIVGDFELIKEELKSGADVNAQIAFDSLLWPGDTALHILLKKPKVSGYYTCIEMLLKHGADISLQNAENLTPCHLDQELIEQNASLLSKYDFTNGNPTNNEGLSHFHLCCMIGNSILIEKFLKSGVDVNIGVDYFAKKYAGYTPLHFVVENMKFAKTEVIELLLNYGADPNIQNADCLDACHIALLYSSTSRKAILRCPKIDVYAPNAIGDTALNVLLKESETLEKKIVKIRNMVESGYELCHKDIEGKTVLHKSTNEDLIQILLSLGADLNIKDDNGKTCVQYVSADNKKLKRVFDKHIQLLQAAGLYVDDLNKIDQASDDENLNIEVEKQYLDDKLKKLIDPSFSADYFFSEKFVVDYKRMSVSLRQKIYDFCTSNGFFDFDILRSSILLQTWKIRARTRLMEPAKSALQAIINRPLPDCIELILNYLNYDDLMNLVRIKYGKLVFSPLIEDFWFVKN